MRLSVSDLQCWQRYRDSEEVALDECLAQLRHESEPTPAMLAGRKLHKALETARYDIADGGRSVVRFEDYTFFFQVDVEIAIPQVRELKGDVAVRTSYGPVTLVGVVDSIDVSIGDYKLSAHFDAERLARSYQWRCYLHMFCAHRFDYKVFVADEIKPTEWVITDYHEFPLYRYPGMEQDIQREVEQCAAFMREYVWPKAA